uniref:Uncharacterized protein n=1 Tax=Janibacter limosus TaxID=53458 RepID=A0AC61U8X9_9MICO|nr:hypothetical protein [Janibacter limosus]
MTSWHNSSLNSWLNRLREAVISTISLSGRTLILRGPTVRHHRSRPDIKGAQPKDKVEVKYETCDNSNTDCTGTRAGCITESGDPNYFQPPTITYVSVNDGPWQNSRTSCGVADSVTIDRGPGRPPLVIPVRGPTGPDLRADPDRLQGAPLQQADRHGRAQGDEDPDQLHDLLRRDWPDDTGLQPGETSKPVTLLSRTIDFKVDAQDYRYDYGDGTHSGWTTSTGGTHLDGDITHKYTKTGDVDIKVDARLTGQYRVNGGEWQDIATTADLRDEPVDTLTVVGTGTRLTADEG